MFGDELLGLWSQNGFFKLHIYNIQEIQGILLSNAVDLHKDCIQTKNSGVFSWECLFPLIPLIHLLIIGKVEIIAWSIEVVGRLYFLHFKVKFSSVCSQAILRRPGNQKYPLRSWMMFCSFTFPIVNSY